MGMIDKYQPLTVGHIVVDHVDIERAAGVIHFSIGKQYGLVGIEGLFCFPFYRRHLPAVTDGLVHVIDMVACHVWVGLVELMEDFFAVVGGLIGAIDRYSHARRPV